MVYHDRLYGHASYSEADQRLHQTKELARLRHVSLSAVPPWTLPGEKACASRFEHSLGVARLASHVAGNEEFEELGENLFFAALAHDMGSPPFSHLSEHFLKRAYGKDHEYFLLDILDDSDFAREVKDQGGDLVLIGKLVTGQHSPIGRVMNGSIDIDNLDNTLRYGTSLGLTRPNLYSPRDLANAYRFLEGTLGLDVECLTDVFNWRQCRERVYEFIYSDSNLSPGMMLFRTHELAANEGLLPDTYFRMNDTVAFNFLLKCADRTVAKLARHTNGRDYYSRAYALDTTNPNPALKEAVGDLFARGRISDEIALLLKVQPFQVCAFLGKDRGHKKLDLPFFDENGELAYNEGVDKLHSEVQLDPTYMVRVFVDPRVLDKSVQNQVQEYIEDRFLTH